MMDDATINRVLGKARRRAAGMKRYPASTYRLQFSRKFTFRDAAALVPYLHELGITDVYASPYLKARPGSLHGYDIIDHNSLNPEIGSEEDYRSFVVQLGEYGMGQILDFVPNHMSIVDNPWWTDVMENGPSSPYAEFFDIDWYPVKPEFHEKVLLPILEDQYGRVLEAGQLRLVFEYGAFFINYGKLLLPIGPKTAVLPLEVCLERLRETLGEGRADFLEMQSIITACRNLPDRYETFQERVAERLREKEIVKKRLRELFQKNEKVKIALSETLDALNGKVGEGRSFDRLHQLLEQQAYRLSYWRVALDEINYRRFLDINELVALKMENQRVFDASHRLLQQLLREGAVTGLRIDHIDGLFAPCEYLWRLQRARFLGMCRDELEGDVGTSATDYADFDTKLLERLGNERRPIPDAAITNPLFVVVEKILGEKEDLRETWPVDGTTGYEFATMLNGIFVNRRNDRTLCKVYRWFTKTEDDFKTIACNCKDVVMRTSMSAETSVLALRLDRVSERSRWYRDFTLNSLKDVIREVIACLPVYRTYIDMSGEAINDRDKAVISAAVAHAKRRNPAVSSSLFDFLRDTLLLKYPPDMDEEGRLEQQQFVMHFQQLTGPVMAKGVEDTAFYRYYPLISLNEVGGNPARFGNSVKEFHRHNARRQKNWRHSLLATSTHDSKRSEDVRARINILSEIPGEWKAALTRWGRLNKRRKMTLDGQSVPDRNEEYLIYQTLLGTYPPREMTHEELAVYSGRIRDYMLKAIREAKVHTSWISPNTAYEEAVTKFVVDILEPSSSFLADFRSLNRLVATCGMYNSLSQVVLKIFSPGIPDIYQGNELWAFSLTDPDNRRPVDFESLKGLFKELKKDVAASHDMASLAETLLNNSRDGRAKLYVVWRSLNYRRGNSALFSEGVYVPLKSGGAKRNHVCAFAWQKERQQLIVATPRLVAELTGNGGKAPTGSEVWGNTCLVLPRRPIAHDYRNIFTGEAVSVQEESKAVLRLAEVFKTVPVAVLESVAAQD